MTEEARHDSSPAILRIAYVLSDEIMDGIGVSHGGWKQGF